MILLVLGLLAAFLMLLSISLLKLYRHVPQKELKRQARSGDELAKLFHCVVSYGVSLEIFLWGCISIFSAIFLVMLIKLLPWPVAFFAVSINILFGFAWLPNAHISRATVFIAKYLTPVIHWFLERLQPVLSWIARKAEKLGPVSVHTGLYTKEDIVDLIRKQKVQIDNRITKEELYIVEHALQYGEKNVDQVMIPRRVMKTVATTDMIGPVLFKELHDSGHSRFPVFKESPDDIVGTLYLRDALNAKDGGFVKDFMRQEVFYVNESQTLARVLDAFIKTKHHQFLVVNSFEEIVGLITIEDVIEQIIGKQIVDEFDSYDDLRAVASMEAKKDEMKREKAVDDNQIQDAHASKDDKTVVESKAVSKKPIKKED